MSNLTLPDGVASIEDAAFYGCKGLKSLTLPSSLDMIGMSAFFGCDGLTTLTIPEDVAYFSAVFRKATGKTPTAFRNR